MAEKSLPQSSVASQSPANNAENLERYAFHLFSQRSASPHRRSAEALTLDCFRDAQAFIATAAKVRSGEANPEKSAGSILADCCAPNLKPQHPLNFVSQRFADKNGGNPAVIVNRVKAILAKLEANPTLGTDQADRLDEVDGLQLNWGPQEINTARAVFPHYTKAAAA